jgi:Zn-dependent protease with chaperone function
MPPKPPEVVQKRLVSVDGGSSAITMRSVVGAISRQAERGADRGSAATMPARARRVK